MTVRKTLARAFRRLTGTRPQPAPVVKGHDTVPAVRERYFYLGPDSALVRLNCGHLLYVDPADEHVSINIIAHGYWEAHVHRVIVSLLRPGANVIEVGANLGYYTVIMSGAVGSTGSVTAFEGNPRLAGMVERSLNLNGFSARSRVLAKAALDQPGTIDFVVSRRNSGGGFVTQWAGQPYDDGQVLKVEAMRLDDLESGRVDMIRIDAEGSEAFILRGAEAILKASPDIVICMEWSVVQIASRTSVPAFVDWLAAMGFKFWRIETDSSLTSIASQDLPLLGNCDIVVSRRTPRTH